jgi:hypothetical protein
VSDIEKIRPAALTNKLTMTDCFAYRYNGYSEESECTALRKPYWDCDTCNFYKRRAIHVKERECL